MNGAFRLGVLAAVALTACNAIREDHSSGPLNLPPPITQAEYTYPACPNEDGARCPRLATAQCAIEWIRMRHALCFEDEECELVRLRPSCVPTCGPFAVNIDESPDFQDEAWLELDRYCTAGTCGETKECRQVQAVPVCSKGFCTFVDPCSVDGGVPDGGCAVDGGTTAGDAGQPDGADAGVADAGT